MKRMASVLSSDSDSDSSDVPIVKKPRATATARNLTRAGVQALAEKPAAQMFSNNTLASGGSGETFTSDLYSSCVSRSLEAMKKGRLLDRLRVTAAKDLEEDDPSEIFSAKSPQPKAKKKEAPSLFPSATSRRNRRPRQSSETSEPREDRYQEYQLVVLDDVEEELSSQKSNTDADISITSVDASFTREPTPPPTPPTVAVPAKRPTRRKKAVKTAINNLEHVKRVHQTIAGKDESDLSIIEVPPSPSKELMVKVRSRSGIQRFPLKEMTSLAELYTLMARHEFVEEKQVTMFFNDKKVKLYDTPASLGITVADIIECYIKKPDESTDEADSDDYAADDPDVLKLHVQGQDQHSRLKISIRKDEPLEKLMRQFCRSKTIQYGQLDFQFDGETITPHQTPDDLDLEDGFCIDVIGL